MSTITAETAATTLVSEGFARDDVTAAIDSLINAGLDAEQPEVGTVLTSAEMDVLRDQLGGQSGHTTVNVADGNEHPDLPYVWWDQLGGPGWALKYQDGANTMDEGLIANDPADPDAAVAEAVEFLARMA